MHVIQCNLQSNYLRNEIKSLTILLIKDVMKSICKKKHWNQIVYNGDICVNARMLAQAHLRLKQSKLPKML